MAANVVVLLGDDSNMATWQGMVPGQQQVLSYHLGVGMTAVPIGSMLPRLHSPGLLSRLDGEPYLGSTLI